MSVILQVGPVWFRFEVGEPGGLCRANADVFGSGEAQQLVEWVKQSV